MKKNIAFVSAVYWISELIIDAKEDKQKLPMGCRFPNPKKIYLTHV